MRDNVHPGRNGSSTEKWPPASPICLSAASRTTDLCGALTYKLGERFTPEYEPYGHLALAIQAQPGTYDFYVVDSAIGEKIDKIWTPSSSCYGPKEMWTAAAMSEKALKADTLEELAKLMEVPEAQFVATIERWNEMVAAGKDEDFNFPGEMMMTIDTPPYYATKEFADGLCTAGGLLVDTECRVLDKDRQPSTACSPSASRRAACSSTRIRTT